MKSEERRERFRQARVAGKAKAAARRFHGFGSSNFLTSNRIELGAAKPLDFGSMKPISFGETKQLNIHGSGLSRNVITGEGFKRKGLS